MNKAMKKNNTNTTAPKDWVINWEWPSRNPYTEFEYPIKYGNRMGKEKHNKRGSRKNAGAAV